MYFYIYDPKWKKTLPYYDTFPLIMPIDYYSDGYLALNFHYLPPFMRARLFDVLLSKQKKIKTKNDELKYLQLSYDVLKGLSNSMWKPTIKRYLYSHVRTPFAQVHYSEWENAIFLPVENFQKAGKKEIWSDSRGMVK